MYCDDTTLCVSATSAPAAVKATAMMATTTPVMAITTTTTVKATATENDSIQHMWGLDR